MNITEKLSKLLKKIIKAIPNSKFVHKRKKNSFKITTYIFTCLCYAYRGWRLKSEAKTQSDAQFILETFSWFLPLSHLFFPSLLQQYQSKSNLTARLLQWETDTFRMSPDYKSYATIEASGSKLQHPALESATVSTPAHEWSLLSWKQDCSEQSSRFYEPDPWFERPCRSSHTFSARISCY